MHQPYSNVNAAQGVSACSKLLYIHDQAMKQMQCCTGKRFQ